MLRYQWLGAALCLISMGLISMARAADVKVDNGGISDYRPPLGFNGYEWQTPLGKFERLHPDPVYVRVAAFSGKVTDFDFDCFAEGGGSECSETEGAGFHALAEYFVDSQGFRLSGANGKAVLFPITYQFCSHWTGFSNQLKGDARERLQLCGARLHFRSETALEEQAITDRDYVTAYQRVLKWLVDTHGEPEGYKREGIVYIQGSEEAEPKRQKTASKHRHLNWYWCRPKGEDLTPRCSASIVLTFDSETGRGQLIYLTPPVWTYAYARQYGGSDGDPLYRVLHGNFTQPSVRHTCTGTFLCEPPKPKPMSEALLARFRLPTQSAPPPSQ